MAIRNPEFGIYPQSNTEIELLKGYIDGFESEEHSLETEVTTYPVEDGRLLTDNLVRQQRKLVLRAVVSSMTDSPANAKDQRVQLAWLAIDQIYRKREPVMVVTPIQRYDGLVLTKATAPVDVNTGRESLHVTLEFSQVLSATVERIIPEEELTAEQNQLLKEFMEEPRERRVLTRPVDNRQLLALAQPIAKKQIAGEALTEEPGDRWAGVKSAMSRAWARSGINARSLARPGGVQAAASSLQIGTVARIGNSARQRMQTVVGGENVSLGLSWLPTAGRWHASLFDGKGNPTATGMALTKHGQPLAGVPTGGEGQPPGEIVVVGTEEPVTPDAFGGGDSEIAFVVRRSAPGGIFDA